MADPPAVRPPTTIDLNREILDASVIRPNVGQDILVVTEDRLKLALIEHQRLLLAKREWLPALALTVTLTTALLTARFEKAFGLEPEFWKSIYLSGAIAAGCWLLVKIIAFLRSIREDAVTKIIGALRRPIVRG